MSWLTHFKTEREAWLIVWNINFIKSVFWSWARAISTRELLQNRQKPLFCSRNEIGPDPSWKYGKKSANGSARAHCKPNNAIYSSQSNNQSKNWMSGVCAIFWFRVCAKLVLRIVITILFLVHVKQLLRNIWVKNLPDLDKNSVIFCWIFHMVCFFSPKIRQFFNVSSPCIDVGNTLLLLWIQK